MNEFLRVAGECGKSYLATGGPTSRLEERLMTAGQVHGYKCDVYATPTAVFVSVRDAAGANVTSLETIQESSTNFRDMLFYDSLLTSLSVGSEALGVLHDRLSRFKTLKFSIPLVTLASFLIGFVASLPRYGNWTGALGSGLITAIIYLLNRPLGKKLKFSSVFTDFVGCLVAFVASIAAGTFLNVPVPSLVIGSLVLIVPGLTLTSAISELAEHNFVSGTVKMMKALLILVAMGVSYVLVENFLMSIGYSAKMSMQDVAASGLVSKPWFQMLARVIMTASFCVFFHLPLRAFPAAMFCGLASILVLDEFKDPRLFVLASFSASLTVGLVSLSLAKIYQWPSQVFSTTGILSLVPGLLALSTFYSVSDQAPQGTIAYRVALTAGAITFGLFTARMPFRFYNNLRNYPVTK